MSATTAAIGTNWRTINIDALDPESAYNFDLTSLTPGVSQQSTQEVQSLVNQARQLARGGDAEGALVGLLEQPAYGADAGAKVRFTRKKQKGDARQVKEGHDVLTTVVCTGRAILRRHRNPASNPTSRYEPLPYSPLRIRQRPRTSRHAHEVHLQGDVAGFGEGFFKQHESSGDRVGILADGWEEFRRRWWGDEWAGYECFVELA